MEINSSQTALIKILCYIMLCLPPWLTGIIYVSTHQPLVSGITVSLILGDPQSDLIVGAMVDIIALGFLSVEGAILSDSGTAGIVGTFLAIAAGTTPEVAVTVVASFGPVGTIVWNLRSIISSVFVHMVDSATTQGDMKKTYFAQLIPTRIATFCIPTAPVFGTLYFGTNVTTQVLGTLGGTPM